MGTAGDDPDPRAAHFPAGAPITRYWRATRLAEDVAWLAARGYRIDRFDCTGWDREARAHDDLAGTLGFPAYYGRNLDALADCLSDLDLPEVGGRALVLARYDVPAIAIPRLAFALLEIVAARSREARVAERHLIALVQSDDPRQKLAWVSGPPLVWNPREADEVDRGS